jgi:iron complex outermembrane receptor protein
LGGTTRAGEFSLSGILSYVHGTDTDAAAPGSPGQEHLYRLMPLNGKVALEHRLGNWSSAFDLQAVDRKKDVQAVRMELPTPGYVLMNLSSGYQRHITDPLSLRLDARIDNLAARSYVLPVGGRYYGPTMMAIKSGSSVPGMGRSFHGGLTFQF